MSRARENKLWYELNRALAVIRSPQSFETEDVCTDISNALTHRGSSFICAEWKQQSEGPILNFETGARRQTVVRCDLDEGHDGDHVDSVVLVNWENTLKNKSCLTN